MSDLQVAVMILSLGFIAFVTLLHIVGKVIIGLNMKPCCVLSQQIAECPGVLYPDMLCVLQLRGK